MQHVFSRIALATVAFALCACTALEGGAYIEAEKAGAEGVAFAFPGLLQGKDKPISPVVRYIFNIHGMGLTEKDYNDGMADQLIAFGYERGSTEEWVKATLAADAEVSGEGLNCKRNVNCLYDTFGQFKVEHFKSTLPGIGDELVVYTYYWNEDLWRIQEQYVGADSERSRALINGMLKKGLVNEGFSDAVAYLGPMKSIVQEGVQSAVCAMLADASTQKLKSEDVTRIDPATGQTQILYRRLSRTPAPKITIVENGITREVPHLNVAGREMVMAGNECLQALDISKMSIDREFHFVTHSLGSRMLLDALTPYAGPVEGSRNANLATLAQQTRTIFMAANQVPLLGLGVLEITSRDTRPIQTPPSRAAVAVPALPAPAVAGDVPGLIGSAGGEEDENGCEGNSFFDCRAAGSITGTVESIPLWVVSFMDPEDALGYRADGAVVGIDDPNQTCTRGITCVRFTQVIHRNTPVWLWLLALPQEAHDKELQRDSSIALIFCGADMRGPGRQLTAREAADRRCAQPQ